MSATRRMRWGLLGAAGLLVASAGCQTWVAGMTLPTGHYLEHPPQYIPPSPSFPLSRELGHEAGQIAPLGGPEQLPQPIPSQP